MVNGRISGWWCFSCLPFVYSWKHPSVQHRYFVLIAHSTSHIILVFFFRNFERASASDAKQKRQRAVADEVHLRLPHPHHHREPDPTSKIPQGIETRGNVSIFAFSCLNFTELLIVPDISIFRILLKQRLRSLHRKCLYKSLPTFPSETDYLDSNIFCKVGRVAH